MAAHDLNVILFIKIYQYKEGLPLFFPQGWQERQK
jgi:hypothetical protein